MSETFTSVAGIGPVPTWYADGLLWALWDAIANCKQNSAAQREMAEKRALELGEEWLKKHALGRGESGT